MQNSKALVGLLILLAGISFFVVQNNKVKSDLTQEQYLIPELQSNINDVTNIIISKNNQTINLNKQEGIWRIAESDDYLADANKIATLLIELRKFELKEKKTSNEENYDKLELSDNTATKIIIKNPKGQFADFSIGKGAQRSQGTYVRKNNDKQTWLATGTVSVKLDSKDWIVTTILDVDVSKIKAVSYKPSSSMAFSINKTTPTDTHFILQNIPEGMQTKVDADLNALANGLQKFSIESAVTKSELPLESKTMTVSYHLFSGMSYQLNLYKPEEEEDTHLMTIVIGNAERDSSFDKQLENWQFVIPKFKFDALSKKMEDFIEAKITDKQNLEKKD